jgi:hypothetical protein
LPEPQPGPEPDALRQVREHLDDAHAAADRLVREAQRQAEDADAAAGSAVPPRGWESARSEPPRATDLQALLALVDAVRDSVPSEITRPIAVAVRDLLLALRALIDWYVERLDGGASGRPPAEAEDIPLD